MLGVSLPPLVCIKRKGHPLGGLSFYMNIIVIYTYSYISYV